MSETNSKSPRVAEYFVAQDERGACYVEELEVESGTKTQIAIFPPGVKVVTVRGQFGPELAQRDMARIRAEIFVTMMERLTNGGMLSG